MHSLVVEQYSFGANPGTKDLARHLFIRMHCGKVVIATDHPQITISLLRKQWLKLMRKVQRERASTLNAARIYELNQIVIKMQTLRFVAGWPPDEYPSANVYLATIGQLLAWAPEVEYRTLYVVCGASKSCM